MHIAVVVVDPTALDEDDAAGCRCGHRGTLSGLRGSQCVRALPRTASGLLYLRFSPMSADAATKSWTVGVQIRLNGAQGLRAAVDAQQGRSLEIRATFQSDFLRRHF
jgi:hypothetical protein